MALKILLSIFILLFPVSLWAAPVVTGVSGTVSNGQTVTITGTGFGANGPTVALFDDFEGGTNGNNLVTTNAEIGTWYDIQAPDYVKYSNANKISGSLAARYDMNYAGGTMPVSKFKLASAQTSVFISYWCLIPSGTSIPGTNGPEEGGANWKVVWIMNKTIGGDDDPSSGDIVLPVVLGSDGYPVIGGNDWPGGAIWLGDSPYNWMLSPSTWWRVSWYLKAGSSSDGAIKLYTMSPSTAQTLILSEPAYTTINSGREWWFVNMMGFGRKDTNAHPTYDDFYIATGAYAQARVEIGNNATYTSCTNLAIITPTSWGNTSITATVRAGSFTSGTAYLFVVDSNGVVNTTGYTVTIGEGDTTPPTLSTATIATNGTSLTLVFSESVTQGAGYNNSHWDVDCSSGGNNLAVTYASGNGTASHVYSIGKIYSGDTCNIDFSGTADSEEDGAGNDLATIVSGAVTNNSTQTVGTTPAPVTGIKIIGGVYR